MRSEALSYKPEDNSSLLAELAPDHAQARTLDPLEFDAAMRELPERNGRADDADVEFVVEAVHRGLDKVREDQLTDGGRPQAIAVSRDLMHFLLSAARRGRHPLEGDNEAAKAMQRLGEAADTAPSGSLALLTLANPPQSTSEHVGSRRRKLTGLAAEDIFLDELTTSNLYLDMVLRTMSLKGITAATLGELENAFKMLQPGTAKVRRGFPADLFTDQYRPFFDPVRIGSERFVTPNAGQSTVTALHAVLTGRTNEETDGEYDMSLQKYRDFFSENRPHLTGEERRWIDDILEQTGGRGSISLAIENKDSELAEANMSVLQALLGFRIGHYRLAAENFNLRPPDAKGGGQYDMAFLDYMVEMTFAQMLALAGAFPQQFNVQDIQDKREHTRGRHQKLLIRPDSM